MFGNKESNKYLSQILDKQNEILKELKDINNNIVKYFGEEYDLKEKELRRKLHNANFTCRQFETVKELVEHVKEKHSKKDNEKCEHDWVYLGCNNTGAHYVCSKCKAFKIYPTYNSNFKR